MILSFTKGFVISDVQIINEAYVDQLGEMVMQDDRENSVRVYITGERKTSQPSHLK